MSRERRNLLSWRQRCDVIPMRFHHAFRNTSCSTRKTSNSKILFRININYRYFICENTKLPISSKNSSLQRRIPELPMCNIWLRVTNSLLWPITKILWNKAEEMRKWHNPIYIPPPYFWDALRVFLYMYFPIWWAIAIKMRYNLDIQLSVGCCFEDSYQAPFRLKCQHIGLCRRSRRCSQIFNFQQIIHSVVLYERRGRVYDFSISAASVWTIYEHIWTISYTYTAQISMSRPDFDIDILVQFKFTLYGQNGSKFLTFKLG